MNLELDERFFTHTLSNGLRIIHAHQNSPVGYCGVAVNVGSRDEADDENGLAHFVEHALFKGTGKRKAWHIVQRMDIVGGEINAFTTKEETTLHCTFTSEHFERALELITDLLFHATFPQKELEKEQGVIHDELKSVEDMPDDYIFDHFEDLLFHGHPLGHNILGNDTSIYSFTSERVRFFIQRFYHPSNMVFFSSGNIPFDRIVTLAERYLGTIQDTHSPHPARIPPPSRPPFDKVFRRDYRQTHVIIGTPTPHADDDCRFPLILLNYILGGPCMNSRLNVALRERKGLVYAVESYLNTFTDAGLFTVYFDTNPVNLALALHLVYVTVNDLCQSPLSPSTLSAIKKQITGQTIIAAEQKNNLFFSLGKEYLHHNRPYSNTRFIERLCDLSTAEIQDAACAFLNPAGFSTLIYTPCSPSEVRKAIPHP
ncbi:MAG: insulinase family protein [Tannerellaceae bacterium]|jgi:predicted Zn-dependent peptidase|nr:insulinase family protein [Tannerellaceae bacterium]